MTDTQNTTGLYRGLAATLLLCLVCVFASCNIHRDTTCTYEVVSVTPPSPHNWVFVRSDVRRDTETLPPLNTRCCKFLQLHTDDDRVIGRFIERIEVTEAGRTREIPPDPKKVTSYLQQEIPVNFSGEVERIKIYLRDEDSGEEENITIRLKGTCSTSNYNLFWGSL